METPYLILQKETDHIIFEAGDRTRSVCERRTPTRGVSVLTDLHDADRLLGFVIWGGASGFWRVTRMLPGDLKGMLFVLRRLVEGIHPGTTLDFGRYHEALCELVEDHRDLPLRVVGGFPYDSH